jgi:hypothetical protein
MPKPSRARRKTARRSADNLAEPSPWRLQHGDVGAAVRAADPDGRPVVHRRADALLARMERAGTITAAMRDAGDAFFAHFRAAALDPLRAASLVRVSGSTGQTLTERHVAARRRVASAIDALGGLASPAGSCIWHVVGCEASIREWAAHTGWNGRPLGHTQAQGILIGALGMLAAHYGYERPARARRPEKSILAGA